MDLFYGLHVQQVMFNPKKNNDQEQIRYDANANILINLHNGDVGPYIK